MPTQFVDDDGSGNPNSALTAANLNGLVVGLTAANLAGSATAGGLGGTSGIAGLDANGHVLSALARGARQVEWAQVTGEGATTLPTNASDFQAQHWQSFIAPQNTRISPGVAWGSDINAGGPTIILPGNRDPSTGNPRWTVQPVQITMTGGALVVILMGQIKCITAGGNWMSYGVAFDPTTPTAAITQLGGRGSGTSYNDEIPTNPRTQNFGVPQNGFAPVLGIYLNSGPLTGVHNVIPVLNSGGGVGATNNTFTFDPFDFTSNFQMLLLELA